MRKPSRPPIWCYFAERKLTPIHGAEIETESVTRCGGVTNKVESFCGCAKIAACAKSSLGEIGPPFGLHWSDFLYI